MPKIIEIKDLRKKLGLSQGEIGIVLGISRSMVQMIERGRRPMSTEIIGKVIQLKEAFKKSANKFQGDKSLPKDERSIKDAWKLLENKESRLRELYTLKQKLLLAYKEAMEIKAFFESNQLSNGKDLKYTQRISKLKELQLAKLKIKVRDCNPSHLLVVDLSISAAEAELRLLRAFLGIKIPAGKNKTLIKSQ